MSDHIENDLPENDAELLLPFYVNGTLDVADREKVEAWLLDNPEAQDHFDRASEELELTRADSESLGVPRRQVLDKLMAEIETVPAGQQVAGWVERVWAMLSPRYAMAGAAALALVIAVQSGYIVSLQSGASGAQFETATGSSSTSSAGVTALVAFAAGAEMATIAERLDGLGLTIVDGPKPGGLFVIGAADDETGRAALETLKGSADLVSFFQLRP